MSLFEKLRTAIPDVAIRTTFIVGFPGETDEEFATLMQFVRDAKLDRVGAFAYSRESGTPSYEMPNQVPFRTKRDRFDRLMRMQSLVATAKGKTYVGRTLRVLVEETKDGWSAGRSYRDAPEIDGRVYAHETLAPGTFVEMEIIGLTGHDLQGRVATCC